MAGETRPLGAPFLVGKHFGRTPTFQEDAAEFDQHWQERAVWDPGDDQVIIKDINFPALKNWC